WFERVVQRLHVALTMGVDSSFEKLSGLASRTPRWMQRVGLEWVYRLFQEPSRLGKRYFIDTAKMATIALPLILYHNLSRLLFWFFSRKEENARVAPPRLFISTHKTMALLVLPPRLNRLMSQQIHEQIQDLFSQDLLLLDFRAVRHLDLTGIG